MALAASRRGEPTAILSESVSARQLRGRLVLLEAHVNGYRVSAGLVSPEDRLALASANERIAWRSLSLYTRSRISAADINEHVHVYSPWLLIADLQPRPIEAPASHDYFSTLALGAQHLARLAHEHHVAVVVRLTLPLGHGRPNRRELPGQGAYAEAFDTVLLLHRGDDDDESTSAASAEAPARVAEVQVVRHGNKDMVPTHVKLHFDQRYASFVD
jgi:replicative DNA helicase